ncbi:MAG: COQ9 family protein [Alphaproteobacteria bacterium]|tara:strand:+ start:132 stop:791 length:660 start_codon:yes stop_codon:yes gene_type:complete
MNSIYIKKCDNVNVYFKIMPKIDKISRILLVLVDELTVTANFRTAFENAAKKLKINSKEKEKLLNNNFPKGYESLNKELNFLINSMMDKSKKPNNFKKLRLNEKIKYFVIKRLQLTHEIFDLKKLAKINLKSKSPNSSLKILFDISDEIWFQAGDKSLDFNFYSKRFILMSIYLNSFLYSISKKNIDLNSLENFVEKQIKGVLTFGKLKSKFKSLIDPK